jgi:acyl carrier protein
VTARPEDPPATAGARSASELLDIVGRLAAELHPRRPLPAVTLDSRLDRELGFDSLGRVELIARLERVFRLALPERLLLSVETPRDLLRILEAAHPATPFTTAATVAIAAPPKVGSVPGSVDTLLAVLDWHVQQHPERPHLYLVDEGGAEEELSYAALMRGAQAVAAGLQARDLRPGQTVAIMLPTGREYFFCFLGALLAGGIPVPIYPPARLAQIEEHLQRHARCSSPWPRPNRWRGCCACRSKGYTRW